MRTEPRHAYDTSMDFQFTTLFRRVPEGYIGFVEELPGANTQGVTLEETRVNLKEAVGLILEGKREVNDDLARKICKDLSVPSL